MPAGYCALVCENNAQISDRLKLVRAHFSLNQKEIASKCGVGLSSYQKYEMGLSIPGVEAIEGFIRIGINANWLLTGVNGGLKPRKSGGEDDFCLVLS